MSKNNKAKTLEGKQKLNDLILIVAILFFQSLSFAYNVDTEAVSGVSVPGAFCECNQPDAFPRIASLFSKDELSLIKEKFETQDPRRPVNRRSSKFKELNAIGQIKIGDRVGGTGVFIEYDNNNNLLILTNYHVAGNVGTKVRFNVGQAADLSKRWQFSDLEGKVIAVPSNPKRSLSEDWSLIRINTSNWSKEMFDYFKREIVYIEAADMKRHEVEHANKNGEFSAASFPAFKDPKYLWYQSKITIKGIDLDIANAASSSGSSGGAIVWTPKNRRPQLVGIIVAARMSGEVAFGINSKFGFSPIDSEILNFSSEDFQSEFVPAFQKAIRGEI